MCDCHYKTSAPKEINIQINNVSFNPQTILTNYSYEAISMIGRDSAIIIPEIIYNLDNTQIANNPFVYNFKTQEKQPYMDVVANGIYPYRVTDATDLDPCCNFWFISLNRHEEPPYNNELSSFRSLIKAHYSKDTNTISFITKYNIPGPKTTPNFESLVQISCNQFLVFSDGFSVFNGQGIVLITIEDDLIKVRDVKLSLNGKILTDQEYDNLEISTAFNVKGGIIFVPQFPENLTNNVYYVSNKQLNRMLKHEKCLVMKAKPVKITIEFDRVLGVTYEGIEAMTTRHGNVYGVTEWSTVTLNPLTFSKPFTGKLCMC